MFMGTRLGDEKFLAGDLEILKRCDAIYMLSNYLDSKGAKEELKFAYEQGKEIYFELDGIPDVDLQSV